MGDGEATSEPGSLRFGVNYTPRHGWFHSWLDFDPAAIEDDLAAIAALGCDHIRIFPLWPLLQPDRNLIRGIDDVISLINTAQEHDLDVVVDVLNGHLSSFDFLPSWTQSWHRRNLFTDPDVVGAESQLVRELARSLRGLPNTIGLSLGNEFGQFAAPRHPDQHLISQDQVSAWLETLIGQADACWPEGMHTHCFDDDIWFEPDHPYTPEHAVRFGDLTTVHAWVFSRIGPHFGKEHPALTWFPRYLLELARGYQPDRALWLQEVGAPSNYVAADQAAEFTSEVIAKVAGIQDLWGITWWCSHDVSRQLADFPELEYSLGLIDSDNKIKPQGEAFARSIQKVRAKEGTATTSENLIIPGDSIAETRLLTQASQHLFADWLERAEAGQICGLRLDEQNISLRSLAG